MNAAIILAAGRGTRMGYDRNKLLVPLCGEPVLIHTVRAFVRSALFDGGIVVVTGAQELSQVRELLDRAGYCAIDVVQGGADRQQSAYLGLRAVRADADIVAIHDGARPLVSREVLSRAIESAREHGSGVAAVLLKDTVKRVDSCGLVTETPDRASLRAVQTPQVFRADLIREAHDRFRADPARATDDASLLERMGVPVRLTRGDEKNIKLTTPEDMLLAEQVLKENAMADITPLRIGHGYDVHRLVEGRKLILCNVEVPYEKGLLGHSDADVALHALMDALLGAAALRDIGVHFPDTDPAYAGADSGKLLEHVIALLGEKGYVLGNADITIIAQRPKLKDYIQTMRERVAALCRTDVSCVNIKATTTEKLGFEGEGLGISAHAVACIVRA